MGNLTPDRWRQLQEVLDVFDDLPAAEKHTFLETIRRDDPALYRQVEALLKNEDGIDSFLETPLFPVCSENLDDAVFVPRIGSYKLIKELGEGGMGVVYLATQEEPFRRRVALKLIRPEMYGPDTIRRFESERQILARIKHPNVAQLHDGGTTPDGRPYFVMEYVEGKPIEEYCNAHRLATRQRLELFLQVCSAVHLAHQKLQVVHRDLKPGNILVAAGGVPKLLDFGIAKLLDDQVPDFATRPTSVLTPNYSSPEQLAGLPLTTASDIYSLGVLLYRLLTGRLPYPKTAGPEDVRRSTREQKPEKPSVAVRHDESHTDSDTDGRLSAQAISRVRDGSPAMLSRRLAGDLDAIMLKAIEEEPEDRYSSVERLAEDIQRYLDGLPVRARENTFLYRTDKFIRRHRLSLATAGALLLILTVSGVTLTVLEMRTENARAKAERTAALLVDVIEVFDPDTAGNRITPLDFLDRARREITADLQADPELLGNLLNEPLAKSYSRLGRYDEALASLRKALDILRAFHPGDYLNTAEVLNNLGAARYRMGDYKGAESRYREAFEMLKRLGVREAELLPYLTNLTTMLAHQGKLNQAAERYLQILEIQRRLLGPDDPKLVATLRSLGKLYFVQGKQALAEPQLREALRVERKAHGTASVGVAAIRSSLGKVHAARGDLSEAESELVRALAAQRRRLASDHIDLGRSERNLAEVLLQAGELPTGEVLLSHAQSALRASKSAGDWEIVELESLLGAYLVEKGFYEEAERCLVESYQALDALRGFDVIYTQQALARVIRLYETWEKPRRVAEYRARLKADVE